MTAKNIIKLNFKVFKILKRYLTTGEVIAFHNHSFTIFLDVGILFGPLLWQMSSKFIKTYKIRNSEESLYRLQSVRNRVYKVWGEWVTRCDWLWITKCYKMDYKVCQRLQSTLRWITKCDMDYVWQGLQSEAVHMFQINRRFGTNSLHKLKRHSLYVHCLIMLLKRLVFLYLKSSSKFVRNWGAQ